jgi:hypothetical protein
MSILDSLKQIFGGKSSSRETVVPEGLCPNCWGKQDYDGQYLDGMRKDNIDLNNATEKLGWIQALALEKVEGIKLKVTDDYLSCPTCKLTYHPKK